METGDLLALLLGGGAVATIGAVFQGIRSLQTGARARERDTVNTLVKQRKEAWADRDYAIEERDYWRSWAGRVEYVAGRAGADIPEKPPYPVKPKDEEDDQ